MGKFDSLKKLISKLPKKAQAEKMGFNTEVPYFHGTEGVKDFPSFRKDELGAFFTPDPQFAEKFSSDFRGGRTIPTFLRTKNTFDYENPEHVEYLRNYLDDYVKKMKDEKPSFNVSQFLNDPSSINAPNNWRFMESQPVQDAIKAGGFDSYHTAERGVKNIAVYDPQNIRSIWANFDPKKSKSSDLLASLGLASAGATAASALSPEEAEASTRIIPRKVLEKLIRESMEDGKLNIPKLLEKMGVQSTQNVQQHWKNLVKVSDLLGHVSLERSGLPEDKFLENLKRYYPEIELLQGGIKQISLKDLAKEGSLLTNPQYGSLAPGDVNLPSKKSTFARDPLGGMIVYPEDLESHPVNLASVIKHEAQHTRDALLFPKARSLDWPDIQMDRTLLTPTSIKFDEIERVREILKSDPNLLHQSIDKDIIENYFGGKRPTGKDIKIYQALFKQFLSEFKENDPRANVRLVSRLETDPAMVERYLYGDSRTSGYDALRKLTLGHHVQYPDNFEVQKAKEIIERGIVSPKIEDMLEKGNALRKKFNEYREVEKEALKKQGFSEAKLKRLFGKPLPEITMPELGSKKSPSVALSKDRTRLEEKLFGVGGAGVVAGSALLPEESEASLNIPSISSLTPNKQLEKMTDEEKSKVMDYLESYGTAARSGVSTATFGLSEPVISGINAVIGNLISSGFDSKDAVDFIKNSINLERIGKEYDEDVEYRKRMKKEHPVADFSGSLVGGLSNLGPAGAVGKTISSGFKKALPNLESAKGIMGAAKRIGASQLEGAVSLPVATTLEHNVGKMTGFSNDEEQHDPLKDALIGGTFSGATTAAIEGAKALGPKRAVIATLPFILSSDINKYIKDEQPLNEQTPLSLEDEIKWQQIKKLIE